MAAPNLDWRSFVDVMHANMRFVCPYCDYEEKLDFRNTDTITVKCGCDRGYDWIINVDKDDLFLEK